MREHEIGIAFQTNKTAAEYVALAKLVDQYDFDVVSVYGDLPFHPPYSALMLMSPHLRRARVGVASNSPSRSHPLDIAANTALLADVAQGGAYVGFSRGAWLEEHGFHELQPPIQAIRESVEIVKQILASRGGGYAGSIFKIADHVQAPYPLTDKPIPVMIGTWGRRLSELAGEIADEVKIGGSANPDMVKVMRSYIDAGAAKVQRLSNEIRIVIGCISIIDQDENHAITKAKEEVALYLPVVAQLDSSLKIEPQLIGKIKTLVEEQDQQSAAKLISNDLINKFALAGSPSSIIAKALELFESGAGRIDFGTPHGIPSEKGIRLLGEIIVPEVRKALG